MAQTNDNKRHDLIAALVHLGVVVVIAAVSITGMLRIADHFRPRIGDILAFDPAKQVAADTEPRIEVTLAGAPSATSCILDAGTMRKSNGSLIIVATRPGSKFIYRAHWAGGPTSDPPTSCGVSADLLLSQDEVSILKMAASQ